MPKPLAAPADVAQPPIGAITMRAPTAPSGNDTALMAAPPQLPGGDAPTLAPVLGGGRPLWVAVHGALMMAAFALLLPSGALLARHRWLFGPDARTVG